MTRRIEAKVEVNRGRVLSELWHQRRTLAYLESQGVDPMSQWAQDLRGDVALREAYCDGNPEAEECLRILYSRHID